MTYEKWTFEGGRWIIGAKGERIAEVYNWPAGYLERGERLASVPKLEATNATLLEALETINAVANTPYPVDKQWLEHFVVETIRKGKEK